MWCKRCQQDVPGVVSPEAGAYVCLRCGDALFVNRAAEEAAAPPPTSAEAKEPEPAGEPADDHPPPFDGWEFEERLRHIERLLAIDRPTGIKHPQSFPIEAARFDSPHDRVAGWHLPQDPQTPAPSQSTQPESALPVLTWTVLSVGLMAFACGGVLLGWSMVSGRQDLGVYGTPITVGGLAGLLIGLILQLDRLGSDHRSTAARLEHVDERLHDLRATTALLGTTQSTPASAFYSHMAGGASPQLLLADLKGQLDLLAIKMAQEEH